MIPCSLGGRGRGDRWRGWGEEGGRGGGVINSYITYILGECGNGKVAIKVWGSLWNYAKEGKITVCLLTFINKHSWMWFWPRCLINIGKVKLVMEHGYKGVCVCVCVHVCERACVCGWLDMYMWEDGWVCGVCVCVWGGLVGDGTYYGNEHELHDLRIEQLLCASDNFKVASFSPFATSVHVIPKWHYHVCFVYMCY